MKIMQLSNKPRSTPIKSGSNRGKPIILFDIDYTLFDTAHFKKTNLTQFLVYEEVVNVLSNLSKKLLLGIFSQGEKDFQTQKLKATKIIHFFQKEHTYIDLEKEELIKKIGDKYKNTEFYIVDDKLPILYLMKKQNPNAFTIWIKRGIYAQNQEPLPDFKPEAVIENLSEIIPLIDQKLGFTLHSR